MIISYRIFTRFDCTVEHDKWKWSKRRFYDVTINKDKWKWSANNQLIFFILVDYAFIQVITIMDQTSPHILRKCAFIFLYTHLTFAAIFVRVTNIYKKDIITISNCLSSFLLIIILSNRVTFKTFIIVFIFLRTCLHV